MTCESRCPECGRKCRSIHRGNPDTGGLVEVGLVPLASSTHAHPVGWKRRTGYWVHAWHTREDMKGRFELPTDMRSDDE